MSSIYAFIDIGSQISVRVLKHSSSTQPSLVAVISATASTNCGKSHFSKWPAAYLKSTVTSLNRLVDKGHKNCATYFHLT